MPGPGQYKPNYKVNAPEEPKFSIKGRYAAPKLMQAPDPGAYSNSFVDKKASPKFGFGK